MPGDSWKPRGGGHPALRILALLAASLGLPYFVLAATSPLLQQWFTRAHPGRSPYRLYALSNAGSLLALAQLPFLFRDPFHAPRRKPAFWGWGLAAYAVGCAFCAANSGRRRVDRQPPRPEAQSQARPSRSPGSGAPAAVCQGTRGPCAEGAPSHPIPLVRLALAAAARVRVGVAAGDDQQAVPGRGGDSVPLGAAAGALSAEFHHLFRQPALVCPLPVHVGAGRRRWAAVLGAGSRQRCHRPQTNGGLLRRAVYLLHGLPRRTLPASSRAAPAHRVLPDDRRRRRAWAGCSWPSAPAAVHGLLRTALRHAPLRLALSRRLRPG